MPANPQFYVQYDGFGKRGATHPREHPTKPPVPWPTATQAAAAMHYPPEENKRPKRYAPCPQPPALLPNCRSQLPQDRSITVLLSMLPAIHWVACSPSCLFFLLIYFVSDFPYPSLQQTPPPPPPPPRMMMTTTTTTTTTMTNRNKNQKKRYIPSASHPPSPTRADPAKRQQQQRRPSCSSHPTTTRPSPPPPAAASSAQSPGPGRG